MCNAIKFLLCNFKMQVRRIDGLVRNKQDVMRMTGNRKTRAGLHTASVMRGTATTITSTLHIP